jgi:hypothetical protein
LHWARDPVDCSRSEIERDKRSGKLVNLVQNGDFSTEMVKSPEGVQQRWREGGPPAGWGNWQTEASKGTFTWDRETGASGKGSAKAARVADGCFIQSHPVAPGERYALSALCKIHGRGGAWLRIRWQTREGRWTAESQDEIVHGELPPDQWRELFAVVEVPAGAGRLVILLGAGGQSTPQDAVWYDNVGLYKIL